MRQFCVLHWVGIKTNIPPPTTVWASDPETMVKILFIELHGFPGLEGIF